MVVVIMVTIMSYYVYSVVEFFHFGNHFGTIVSWTGEGLDTVLQRTQKDAIEG